MPNASVRLHLRLSAADKARISRAADLRGVPLATFVREAVLREAETVVASARAVELSPDESRRFLAALDEPCKANSRLAKAMEDVARLTH
jgi:uncharacterized protein (DUF1778 family)